MTAPVMCSGMHCEVVQAKKQMAVISQAYSQQHAAGQA